MQNTNPPRINHALVTYLANALATNPQGYYTGVFAPATRYSTYMLMGTRLRQYYRYNYG